MKLYLLLIPLILSVSVPGQQKPLHNEDILKMVQAGLGAEPILTMISAVPCEFDTSPDGLIGLKKQGVPDSVITAMVNKARQPAPSGGPAIESTSPAPPANVNEPRLVEVGVYYIQSKSGELIFMEPEIVTWKTGGVLKSMATMGLTKGHVNGIVKGAGGRYSLKGDEQIFIYCPEGVSGAEYQLLRLWDKKDRREFRAATGGIVHASGGADENAIVFQPVRVSPRIYKVQLLTLAAGEYGLLPPGAVSSASAASVGKIYSFTVRK